LVEKWWKTKHLIKTEKPKDVTQCSERQAAARRLNVHAISPALSTLCLFASCVLQGWGD
jgi:hypothetical protein